MGKVLPHSFTLSELVKEVRKELLIIRGDEKIKADPIMTLKNLEMELQVDLSAEVDGGFKFVLVDFGSKVSGNNTHRIKLVFEPYQKFGTLSEINEGGLQLFHKPKRKGEVRA